MLTAPGPGKRRRHGGLLAGPGVGGLKEGLGYAGHREVTLREVLEVLTVLSDGLKSGGG